MFLANHPFTSADVWKLGPPIKIYKIILYAKSNQENYGLFFAIKKSQFNSRKSSFVELADFDIFIICIACNIK